MTPTVFYSWQSDLPPEGNKNFIRSCLEEALANTADILPLRRDEAAEGETGSPDIPAVIFKKLTEATAAVFDMTPVGSTSNGKSLQNPNVSIELGYAAHGLGWPRILCIFNKAYGRLPQDLPFDLRHRRFPIVYQYDSKGEPTGERAELTARLKEYVKLAMEHPHLEAVRTRKRFTTGCVDLLHRFGKQPSFPYQAQELRPDVEQLLDLGVIEIDVNPKTLMYAYHWTPLGGIICEWYQKELEKNPKILEALAKTEAEGSATA